MYHLPFVLWRILSIDLAEYHFVSMGIRPLLVIGKSIAKRLEITKVL